VQQSLEPITIYTKWHQYFLHPYGPFKKRKKRIHPFSASHFLATKNKIADMVELNSASSLKMLLR